jgi:hypothetical protein
VIAGLGDTDSVVVLPLAVTVTPTPVVSLLGACTESLGV